MKKFYCLLLMLLALPLMAAEKTEDWKGTTLSEDSIKNIQQAKYKYLQCITDEVQKKDYQKMDTRVATDKIIQQCEKTLTDIRSVFLAEKVPEAIADRYLKRTRTQTARKVLEQMMYAAAERQAAGK
ncbi:MAG: hypothetical protein ACU837_05760 [Gammaproteobacteria bacterium]